MLPLLFLLATAPGVSISASVDGAAAKSGWVYARVGQKVVLQARVNGGKAKHFSWFKLEPVQPFVDNTAPKFHFAPIEYRAVELEGCRDHPQCPAEVAVSLLPAVSQLPGVGTMGFQLKVELEGGAVASSPGVEATKYGGLTDAVMRVTFRRDDSYLGFVSELINTPYIFGSAGPDGRNQSDLLIGSDCADLAVYGQRRLGQAVKYTSSYGLDQQAPERFRGVSTAEDGRILDKAGKPIEFGSKGVRPGDVLHFPDSRHVGVLYEDRPPLGVLDSGDLMIHTCWAPPKIEPIGESRCASLPWRVLRFP